MGNYDIRSTLIYAVGKAIETEEDILVREQLEDLEDKMAIVMRRMDENKVKEMFNIE